MNLHRILSGSPERRGELIAAGIFVLIWFVMDVAQWIDWVATKLNPPPHALCLPLPISTDRPPVTMITPGYYCGNHDCSLKYSLEGAK
jgi:hypothetical protein